MEVGHIFEKFALAVESAAIAVIMLGIVIATGHYIFKLLRKQGAIETFGSYRDALARTLPYPLSFWLLPTSSAPWRLTIGALRT